MKRAISIMLALLLSFALTPALAEGLGLPDGSVLPMNTSVAADLDGDGASEHVSWTMVPGEFEEPLTLTVELSKGETLTYETGILGQAGVCILDLDGDGILEILMTGDVMSDDYYTWCLRLSDGALREVLFPDSERGENTKGYFKYGYGLLTGVDGAKLTLTGSQDMLGTWMASRTVELGPVYRFEFCDDGLWHRAMGDVDGDDLWAYAALTTTAELPYADAEGNAGVLAPGTKLLITATDKQETAHFTTQDGVSGTLAVSEDYERGWGNLIDGVPEDQCFEYLPYAD